MASKIHLTVNAVGRICRLIVGTGNEINYKQASALTQNYQLLATLADKGYDADWFMEALTKAGVCEIVIPPNKNRRQHRC